MSYYIIVEILMRVLFVARINRPYYGYILNVNGINWSGFRHPQQWANNEILFRGSNEIGMVNDLINAIKYLIDL